MSPPDASRLFVYGSLMWPEVVRAVVGRELRSRRARLDDARRLCVAGARYPGLVAQRGSTTAGAVLEAVDAAAWRALDRFEGPLYVRRPVAVTCGDASVLADTYFVRPEHRERLTAEEWDPAGFDVDRFLRGHGAWLLRRALPSGGTG